MNVKQKNLNSEVSEDMPAQAPGSYGKGGKRKWGADLYQSSTLWDWKLDSVLFLLQRLHYITN